jgi:hypothetical protein
VSSGLATSAGLNCRWTHRSRSSPKDAKRSISRWIAGEEMWGCLRGDGRGDNGRMTNQRQLSSILELCLRRLERSKIRPCGDSCS